MKKLMFLIIAIVALGLIVSGCGDLLVTPVDQGEVSSLTKVKPDKPDDDGFQPGLDFNGPHFNLNLIGKKSTWSGGGSYDNPDRHTIFVPEDTTGWQIETPGDDSTTNVGTLEGIKILMTQGTEFAVIDGNGCDGEAAFQLGPGTYRVYIVAKAKPAKKDAPEYYTNITGWVYAEDEGGVAYYFDIGSVKVTKSKKWKDATDLFYVSPKEDYYFNIISEDMWVFEYLNLLEAHLDDPSTLLEEPVTEYFWQYDNHGNKLVKVRFYPDPVVD